MRSRRSTTAVFLLVIGSLLLPAGHVAADQEQLCGDVQLVHARGMVTRSTTISCSA